MLEFMPDELVHSYIYRSQYCSGIFNYENLIDNRGEWRENPKLLKQYLYIYEPLDEQILHNGLMNIFGFKRRRNPFFGPYFCTPTLAHFFLSRYSRCNVNTNVARYIRFCSQCINDQIYENGFGYLKLDWFRDIECKQHSQKLLSSFPQTVKQATDFLQDILSGNIPKSCEAVPTSSIQTNERYIQNNRTPFLACALLEFQKKFSNELARLNYYSSRSIAINLIDNSIEVVYPSKLYLLYLILLRRKDPKLIEFRQYKLERIQIDFGISTTSNLKPSYYKAMNRSCKTCRINCPENPALPNLRRYLPEPWSTRDYNSPV